MEVTCEVVGGETRTVALDESATYADLLAALDLSPQTATAVVDGSPVPADAAVAADSVGVLRLVQGGAGPGPHVRPADEGHLRPARALVDRAMLSVPEDAEWLVAVHRDRVVGSLALAGDEVAAVAVRRDRRGEGIGRALVSAAADRRDRLTATFRRPVRGFYEAVGFAVAEDEDEDEDQHEHEQEDGRCRGLRRGR